MNTPPKLSFACPMSFAQMSGTERSRFCEKCGHHVRNLSLMSVAERAELHLRAQTERICGAYYVRLSGEMVTPEAPLTRSEWSRVKQYGVAALSAGALALAAGCVSPSSQHPAPPPAILAAAAPAATPSVTPPPAPEAKQAETEEVVLLMGFCVDTAEPESHGYMTTEALNPAQRTR